MAQPGTIEAVMTTFPYSIDYDAHAGTAWSMLNQLHIHHLPVREGERVFGVITDRDLKRAQILGQDLSADSGVRVADVCSRDVYIVTPETSLIEVLENMADQQRDVALVVRQEHLVGIFTLSDVCRRYAEFLRTDSTRVLRR
jgi:acetoin utilization protein AcuB